MKIDTNKTVYDLVAENAELKNELIKMGFVALANPIMLQTMAKKVSLKQAAKILGVDNISEKLVKLGYEVIDGEQVTTASKRKELLKSYIERLSQGENVEDVKKDFVNNFKTVSSSEIMTAEEELLNSTISKEKTRKLCDIHSALFHGMTDNENNKEENYEHEPFISYMVKENHKVKELIKAAFKNGEINNDLLKISSHYKKKGDLIYPILKVKYHKPGPSDIMWAVDVEILKNLKKASQEKNKKLWQDTLTRAEEMTYKEENILYPLLKETLHKEDLQLLYLDLKDYDHDFLSYDQDILVQEKDDTDKYIHFKKGKMRIDQLEAMLDTMEFEITFVDENDINAYYNDNKETKIFKRPMSSLGREVYTCHPPQVEPMVRKLINDFKEGNRDSFRLIKQMGEKDYSISYYAVRDKGGNYKGVLEIVEDISFYKNYYLKNK